MQVESTSSEKGSVAGHSGVAPSPRRSRLGHGIGLRAEFFAELLAGAQPAVDFMEVISENLFQTSGRAWEAAMRVREQMPLTLHGVGMGLGDEWGPSDQYLQKLGRLIDRLEPAMVSDHLCFTSAHGHYTHDLLPLPRTKACARRVVEHIDRVQSRLKRQLLIENISTYVEFADNDWPEPEFLAEVTRRSGCGLLLDVNNVLVNATNHNWCPEQWLGSMPADAVKMIHVAGHTAHPEPESGPLLIDTHVGPVPEAVWGLLRTALALCGDVPTVVEWDEDVPALATVVAEADKARDIAEELLKAQEVLVAV